MSDKLQELIYYFFETHFLGLSRVPLTPFAIKPVSQTLQERNTIELVGLD